jgi:PadR family transcriptional regulator PadR
LELNFLFIYLSKLYIMKSKEYIKGTIKTIVLKLLSEKDRMYGYEISQRVKELSSGEISLTYGALYPILYKLEDEGLLTTQSEIVDGRGRKYYSLTASGNVTAKEKIAELARFVESLKNIMAPAPGSSLQLWGL